MLLHGVGTTSDVPMQTLHVWNASLSILRSHACVILSLLQARTEANGDYLPAADQYRTWLQSLLDVEYQRLQGVKLTLTTFQALLKGHLPSASVGYENLQSNIRLRYK